MASLKLVKSDLESGPVQPKDDVPSPLMRFSSGDLEECAPYVGLGSQKLLLNNLGFTRADEHLVHNGNVVVRIVFPQNNGLKNPLICIAGLACHEWLVKSLSTYTVRLLWLDEKREPRVCELGSQITALNYVHDQNVERPGEKTGMIYAVHRRLNLLSTKSYGGVETGNTRYQHMSGFCRFKDIELYNGHMRYCEVLHYPDLGSFDIEPGIGLTRVSFAVPITLLQLWSERL